MAKEEYLTIAMEFVRAALNNVEREVAREYIQTKIPDEKIDALYFRAQAWDRQCKDLAAVSLLELQGTDMSNTLTDLIKRATVPSHLRGPRAEEGKKDATHTRHQTSKRKTTKADSRSEAAHTANKPRMT